MKKLSIIISAYDSGEWIKNRLDNIYNTRGLSDYEVILVNANSPDERDDIIPKEYPLKYIKLQERIGLYAAWNIAINASESEYITNANTDDIVSPDLYARLVSILDNGYDFAYSSWYVTNDANQHWDNLNADPSGRPGNYTGDIERAGVGHFPMWRRSLHDKVGMFDERFKALGDADFWARCYYLAKAKFFWHQPLDACYLFRNGQNLWHQAITSEEWQLYHSNVARIKNGG